METITSVKNKEVLDALELKERKYQLQREQYLVEGLNIVQEALKHNVVLKIFGTKKFLNKFESEQRFILISDNVATKLSDLKNSQEIFAICSMSTTELESSNVLLIDGVQDPGNLGTLIRTAFALGFNNIYCSLNTVNLYNPKVLRAVQGNHFEMNIVYQDLRTVINFLKTKNYKVFGTCLTKPTLTTKPTSTKYALVLGNEGQGISQEIMELCDYNLIIPINPKVESLNVAIAGAILMYQIKNENVF